MGHASSAEAWVTTFLTILTRNPRRGFTGDDPTAPTVRPAENERWLAYSRTTAAGQARIRVCAAPSGWQATSRETAQTTVTVALDAPAIRPYHANMAQAERSATSVVSHMTNPNSRQFIR